MYRGMSRTLAKNPAIDRSWADPWNAAEPSAGGAPLPAGRIVRSTTVREDPMSVHEIRFADYQLADRYTMPGGRVFLTGTQALVRVLFDQARRDRTAGLSTGGFVSGYRGSPLGGARPGALAGRGAACEPTASSSCPPSTRTSPPPPCSAPSRWKRRRAPRSMAFSPCGTARGPASTAPETRSSTATPTAPRRAAACWWWPATTTAACRRRCRTSPTSPSWPGSCRP